MSAREPVSERTMTCSACKGIMREYIPNGYFYPILLCDNAKCHYHSSDNCAFTFPENDIAVIDQTGRSAYGSSYNLEVVGRNAIIKKGMKKADF